MAGANRSAHGTCLLPYFCHAVYMPATVPGTFTSTGPSLGYRPFTSSEVLDKPPSSGTRLMNSITVGVARPLSAITISP